MLVYRNTDGVAGRHIKRLFPPSKTGTFPPENVWRKPGRCDGTKTRGIGSLPKSYSFHVRGQSAGAFHLSKEEVRAMNRRRRIYEGKAKVLYEGPEPGTLIQHFKDDATAFNNKKHERIEGKGVLNNRISEYLFSRLGEMGVPTHFIRRLNMREQLIREVEIIPLEVVVRNIAAGSLCERLGLEEGTQLPRSIIEFYYKNDQLGDPMVSEEHITAFGWATPQEIDEIMALSLRINDFLSGLFLGIGIRLVDFKVEFGRLYENENMRIVLADEISPDCCRLWDIETRDKLDKDRFRRDLGGLVEAYQEVARRLGILVENSQVKPKGPVLVRSN
jgi:phosphoribosylaminoimidazole-succinocarboxamide synthase